MSPKKSKTAYPQMTKDELDHELEDQKGKLFKARTQSRSVPLKNPMVIRQTRREIARILTQIRLRLGRTENA